MCGILAIFCHSMPKQTSKIISVSKYLQCRGKHGLNIIKSSGIYICYENDKITMKTKHLIQLDNLTLFFDGNIYNKDELIKKFGLQCTTSNEYEVIIRLYQKIGFVEAVKRIDGEFALLIKDKDMLYIARDNIGTKPLYFGTTEQNNLAICSIPQPLTQFCSDISQFQPGLYAKIDLEKSQEFSVLYDDRLQLQEHKTSNNATEQLCTLLTNAIRKRVQKNN